MSRSVKTAMMGIWAGLAAASCSAVVDFDQCSVDSDCKQGQKCDLQSKGCYDVTGGTGGTAGGGADASTGGNAAGGNANPGGTDGGNATGGTTGGTPNPDGSAFGEACLRNEHCASGVCDTDTGRCSTSCNDTAQCDQSQGIAACQRDACRFLLAPPLDHAKVGFLYVGPVGDFGWTKTHDEGRKAMEAHFQALGLPVETTYEPAVADDKAAEAIDKMITEGANVIVATSYSYIGPLQAAAAVHKDLRFLSCSGFIKANEQNRNLGSYFGKMQQAVYLAGRVAGRATNTKIVGVVGSVPIPELVRHIDAFALGVRAEKPDAEVQVRWINAFYDGTKEPAAANELIDAGADVIWSSTDSQLAMDVASRRTTAAGDPVLAIGNDNPDACTFAPDICLTTPYWNWGPVLTRQIQGILDGTWDYRDLIWESIKGDAEESMVNLAPVNMGLLPGAALWVEPLVQEMARGDLDPFDGEIRDNKNMVRVAAGSRLSDSDSLGMCWFVDGIFEPGTEHVPAEVPALCDAIR